MSLSNQIKLYVTVDKLMYREAILYQLLLRNDIELVGESQTGVETLSEIAVSKANVLIIDEDLRDNDGLTISEIALGQHPSLSILLLVDHPINQQRLSIYLESGIKSVVSKTQTIKDLINALYYIKSGQIYIDGEQFREGVTEASLNQSRFKELSTREQEVARLIAKRASMKDIAEQLGVSNKTIHTYKERIFVKMGFERLPELMLFMQRYMSQNRT